MSGPAEGVANRLRLAREQAGLTQGQASKLMGMHRPTVSEIEAARRRVTAEELVKFAGIYKVDLAWLMGTGPESSVANDDRVTLAARELSKLKDEELDAVMSLLSSLKRKQ